MNDHLAEKQLEIVIGSDRIIRINIDGTCVLRVRLEPGAEYVIDNRGATLEPKHAGSKVPC